jgi:hypothetical protein
MLAEGGTALMYEPTQEVIVAELRLRGMAQVADIVHILGAGFASLIPHEIQRMKEIGLVVYDEPLGLDSVLRLP